MTYSNMDNVPTQTAGTSELLASDWNTYVRDNFDAIKYGHIVVADATARTNLGNVAEGVMVYQSDNNKVYVNSNGTTANWVEVADLDNTGAVSDDAADYLDQYAVQSRNVIINGAMQVAQRATSKAGITGTGYNTADRWNAAINALGTWTNSVENDAPTGSGLRKSWKWLCTTADAAPAAGDYCVLEQRIEGQNLQHFAKGTSSAKKIALQFWVKANVTGTYIVEIRDDTNSRHISKAYTISASGTWEKKTLIFDGDTTGALANDNTSGFNVEWWLAAGSTFSSGTLATSWAATTNANRAVGQTNLAAATNNYWQVTGVQLEAGDVATPFEFEPFETTVRKCQRYYVKSYDINVAVGTNTTTGVNLVSATADADGFINYMVYFPVNMRAVPTFSFWQGNGTADNWNFARSGYSSTSSMSSSNGTASMNNARIYCSIGGSGYAWNAGKIEGHWAASAEL